MTIQELVIQYLFLGTGCFILYNTGEDLAYSRNGLLTTVAYKWNNDNPVYALEVLIRGCIFFLYYSSFLLGFYCYCW